MVLTNPTVTPVETIGDWILLSRAIKHLVSCLWHVIEWLLPVPTVVNPKVVGGVARASEAVGDNLIRSSLTFTA